MQKSELVSRAREFARRAHEGQFRRDEITPYFTHIERVMERLRKQEASDFVLIVAAAHDQLEDHRTSFEVISKEFGTDVALAVSVLSKPKDMEDTDYLKRIKHDPYLRQVKIADMLDNLSDSPTEKQIIKYAKGLLFLLT